MTPLARIRHQRRSATVLSVMVLAWVGILVTPCASTFAAAAPSPELVAAPHDDCPNADAQAPMSAADCCCDLNVALTAQQPDPPKPGGQLALPVERNVLRSIVLVDGAPLLLTTLRHRAGPPVYLSTRRLRI